MGWQPGKTTPLDLGEIPHKRQISDEELENLRANAPDREERELRKAHEIHQQNILNGIIDAGDDAIDALTIVNTILDDEEDGYGVQEDVLDDGFRDFVEKKLQEIHSQLDVDLVVDIWRRRELSTEMFYFGIDIDSSYDSGCRAIITPIAYWEENNQLDNRQFEDYVVPEWLVRHQDHFEVVGKTPAQARRDLINLGFHENHEVIQ